jgi:FSR family fosmidomycin resistance protein-like MFS transporter
VTALSSAAGTLGGLLPLTLGLVAQQFGLVTAMWLILAAPVALLIGLPARRVIARR